MKLLKLLNILLLSCLGSAAFAAGTPKPLPADGKYVSKAKSSLTSCFTVSANPNGHEFTVADVNIDLRCMTSVTGNIQDVGPGGPQTGKFRCIDQGQPGPPIPGFPNDAQGDGYFGKFSKNSITFDGLTRYEYDIKTGVTTSAQTIYVPKQTLVLDTKELCP